MSEDTKLSRFAQALMELQESENNAFMEIILLPHNIILKLCSIPLQHGIMKVLKCMVWSNRCCMLWISLQKGLLLAHSLITHLKNTILFSVFK